jgi:predicted helicase
MNAELERIKSIKSFPSLVKYLREELDWKIDDADIDDLTFDYDAAELGIDKETAVKIKEIKQLRPLVSNQPWGIFYLSFEPKRLPIVALRRILRSLVIKKRESANRSQMATWEQNDLLFISSYGEQDNRELTFAHFSDNTGMGDLPTLRVLGWSAGNTVLRLEDTYTKLKENLHWPQDDANVQAWREQWSSAFTLQYRENIRTSKDLATRLAKLAEVIRKSVNDVLQIETEKGELRKLYKAFQEALIHDLTEDDFADMYAQTIAYGLLSARISRTSGALVADNLSDLIPNTNPFLKELMQTFLTVGGRKSKIDFDELGINEVVELLRNANMEEVLKDFGAKNPNEDPVIHFYELFLKEYDPEKRMKRGVFYTPRPVVSFIVRSVDEILRNEFGLVDGLADTTTWGEMKSRIRALVIPDGVKETAPFVQILDPATGTGTFLVEVIDLIYKTMSDKWRSDKKTDKEIRELWNEYVPEHLLPRLYGFELMMAPYSIAHMKIGLKLRETNYSFISSERAQIYLTNTLEEPEDFSDYFKTMAPALAHEADAANRVKRHTPITVVIGNPPYSGISNNMNPWIDGLLKGRLPNGTKVKSYYEVDGKPLGEKKLWLQDDYVKFVRYGQHNIDLAGIGVLAYISNHSYANSPTYRGMRQQLLFSFNNIRILDLHGNATTQEQTPSEVLDENVFDIKQGVAIGIFLRSFVGDKNYVGRADLWGSQGYKYEWLLDAEFATDCWIELFPNSPYYFFANYNETDKDEYEIGWKITDIMKTNVTGIVTARDQFVTDFDIDSLLERIADFRDETNSDAEIRERYFGGKTSSKYQSGDSRGWKLPAARIKVQKDQLWRERIVPYLYRPFDKRSIYYVPWMVDWPRTEGMRHMLTGENLGLVWTRPMAPNFEFSVGVSNSIIDQCAVGNKSAGAGISYIGSLYLVPETREHSLLRSQESANKNAHVNLAPVFIDELSSKLGLVFSSSGPRNLIDTYCPEDVFDYIYAVFHCPTYRSRYAQFLKIDFPRLPLTTDVELFRKLCALGAELVALHLLEEVDASQDWNLKTDGSTLYESAEVATGFPKYEDGKVFINKTAWFDGVAEEVWNFHIGGYQVCHKWLKDRGPKSGKAGRTLSVDDIAHYGKITVALRETIRLMAEIDEVIDAHGGFPLVGSGKT